MGMIKKNNQQSYCFIIKYLILYTAIFLLIIVAGHFVLFYNGKTLLYIDDCISAYPGGRILYGQALRNLFGFGSSWMNFNLSGDDSISSFGGVRLFDIVWPFLPKEYLENTYIFLSILRIYLGGLIVSLLCFYKGMDYRLIPLGSMVYISYGFIMIYGLYQPVFFSMFLISPILMLGIDMIIKEKRGLVFSLALGISLIQSPFQTYYISIGLLFYMIIVIFEYHMSKSDVIHFFVNICKYCFMGVLIGMPFVIWAATNAMDTQRLSNELNMHHYSNGWIKVMLQDLASFFVTDSDYAVFSTAFLFPAVCLVLSKSKYRGYLIAIIIGLFVLKQPFAEMLLGKTIATNRWSYVLGAFEAVICAGIWPELIERNELSRKMNIVAVLYSVVALVVPYYTYKQNKSNIYQRVRLK